VTSYDLIVVGSGLAGLHAAQLGAEFGTVLLLTKSQLEDCNTAFAQGGIAAALFDGDTPSEHFRDTVAAGAGLCDPAAVSVLVEEGPRRVRELIELGVPFDRAGGRILATREAAHSYPRILHAGGDATGARIERTMAGTVRTASRVVVRENTFVTDLIVRNGRVTGVRAIGSTDSVPVELEAGAVILATGGAGQLYSHTTNPPVATGDGIALAFRAGADVADMEFVQFHPTALAVPDAPRFLISEALRGEGGILRNAAGERLMRRYDERGELAPRDVVARSIAFELRRTGDASAYLDVSHLGAEQVRQRFPTIARVCSEFGIDIGREPIPVAPAAHYLMGGIRADTWGRTSLPGLYACGECACSGVHGANRLASNSLLETLVFSDRAVRHCFGVADASLGPIPADGASTWQADRRIVVQPDRSGTPSQPRREEVQEQMWARAGLMRDVTGLDALAATTSAWFAHPRGPASRESLELANLVSLSRLVATAAQERAESRGAHYRTDQPTSRAEWRRRIILVNPAAETVSSNPASRRRASGGGMGADA
jgi:L-aspartate oxidase